MIYFLQIFSGAAIVVVVLPRMTTSGESETVEVSSEMVSVKVTSVYVLTARTVKMADREVSQVR